MTDLKREDPSPVGRVVEYDLIRVLSIALVVLIHVLSPFYGNGAIVLSGVDVVKLLSREIRFVVPMYVVLTGALVWTRPSTTIRGWTEFFVRRARTVLVPYVVWSSVFVLIPVVGGSAAFPGVRTMLRHLLLGSAHYHLYFVPIILGVYALAPVASWVWRTLGGGVVFVLSIVAGIAVPLAIGDLDQSAVFQAAELVATFLPYAGTGALYAVLRKDPRWQAVERWAWPLILVGGLVVRAWFGAVVPWPGDPAQVLALAVVMNVLQCIAFLGMARYIAKRWPSFAARSVPWAPVVLGVYLAHPLLLRVLMPLLDRGILPAFPWAVLAWTVVTLTSFVAMRRLSRYRGLWWVHGVFSRPSGAQTMGARESVR